MTAAYSRSVPARKRLTPHFRGAPRKEKGPPRRRRPPSYRLYRIGCRATSPARLRLRFQAAGRLAGVLALAGVLRRLAEIGRAHVLTPVTNATPVCRTLI